MHHIAGIGDVIAEPRHVGAYGERAHHLALMFNDMGTAAVTYPCVLSVIFGHIRRIGARVPVADDFAEDLPNSRPVSVAGEMRRFSLIAVRCVLF